MQMRSLALSLAATALLGLSASLAQASVIDVQLSGNPAHGNAFHTQTRGVDNYVLPLDGVSVAHPVRVAQGDTVNATLSFTGPLTVPASSIATMWVLLLQGPGFPTDSVLSQGTVSMSFQGAAVASYSTNCGTSGQLASCFAAWAPDSHAVTVDRMMWTFDVTQLSAPAAANSATFNYSLNNAPVPEPASVSLLAMGLAALALKARRRAR